MPFYTQKLHAPASKETDDSLFARLVSRIFAARDRSVDVHRLQRLSDTELAKLGLSRQAIMRHVYSDVYSI